MLENMNSATEKAITRAVIVEMLVKNFERLPDIDQKVFKYGSMYFGANAGLVGLVANSLFRRALNVTQAHIASSLAMAGMPFLTTMAVYHAAVQGPLLSGDLNCSSCTLLRGTLVGIVSGAIYPIIVALPLNLGLATQYNTALMPEKGNLLRFSLDLSRPILRKMRAAVVLQAFFGTFLASRQYQSYTRLVEITFPHGEELQD